MPTLTFGSGHQLCFFGRLFSRACGYVGDERSNSLFAHIFCWKSCAWGWIWPLKLGREVGGGSHYLQGDSRQTFVVWYIWTNTNKLDFVQQNRLWTHSTENSKQNTCAFLSWRFWLVPWALGGLFQNLRMLTFPLNHPRQRLGGDWTLLLKLFFLIWVSIII